MFALLKEKFVCVQEVIPGAETKPEDLTEQRRQLLERFARQGRFFFGKIRILSPDGKNVLAELRSFPGADEETRKQDRESFLALANDALAGKVPYGPRAFGKKTDGPPFLKEGGPPLKKTQSGPKVGDQAPDFELKFLDAKETFKLSANFNQRPTVLIFHSFT